MYRVAVCDDEELLLEELSRMCDEILKSKGVEHTITSFSSAREIQDALNAGERFDLICLDIIMPGQNGMELAHELRQWDDETSILFVTSSTDFLLKGYGVRPIQYLLKPVKAAELEKALSDDIRLNHASRTVSVTAGGKTTVIPHAAIRYVESRDHGCAFVMEDREQFFWLSMSQVEELLPKDRFCRCHNSYMVNLDKVVRADSRSAELAGKVTLPVSRRFSEKFQSALTRYLNR